MSWLRHGYERKWKDSYQRQCGDGWYDEGGVVVACPWSVLVLLLDSVTACHLWELEEQAWLKDLQGDSFRLYSPSHTAAKMSVDSRLCKIIVSKFLEVCIIVCSSICRFGESVRKCRI